MTPDSSNIPPSVGTPDSSLLTPYSSHLTGWVGIRNPKSEIDPGGPHPPLTPSTSMKPRDTAAVADEELLPTIAVFV